MRDMTNVPAAKTGIIYEFLENSGKPKNMVLVVQNPKREEDNIVSVLMLGTKSGADSIQIDDKYCVHCGLVTYCGRERLGDALQTVSDETMRRIKKGIMWQLGLEDDSTDYKALYDNLLDKLTK